MIRFNPFTHVLAKYNRSGTAVTHAIHEASTFVGFKLNANNLQLNTLMVIENFRTVRVAIEFWSERIPHAAGSGFNLDYNIKNIEIHREYNNPSEAVSNAHLKLLILDYFNALGWNIPNIKERISKSAYTYYITEGDTTYQCCGLRMSALNDTQYVYTLSDYVVDNTYKDFELVLHVFNPKLSMELSSRVNKQSKCLLFKTQSIKRRNKYLTYLLTAWINFRLK